MIKKRYIASATVLVAVTLLIALALSLVPSYARINNVASWKVVYTQKASKIESNFLEAGGQNVYLGPWIAKSGATSIEKSIRLSASSDIAGTLSCTSDSTLVSANLSDTDVVCSKTAKNVKLTLIQTLAALSLTEQTKVTVTVKWTPAKGTDAATETADFIVILCPEGSKAIGVHSGIGSNYLREGGRTVQLGDWVMSTVATYKTKDIEIVSDGTDAAGELTCTSDSSYITAAIDNKTEPIPVKVSKNGVHISSLKLTPSESAKNITEAKDVNVTVTWKDSDSTAWVKFKIRLLPEGTKSLLDNTPSATIDLSSWKTSFEWNTLQTFPIPCPENSDTLVITYNGSAFPEGTRYSTDKVNFVTLGESMNITIPAVSAKTAYLFLDMSGVELADSKSIGNVTFGVFAYKNGVQTAYGSKVTTPYYTKKPPLISNNATPESFSIDSVTAFQFTPSENATHIKLSLNGSAFPKGTRYSFDGKSYTVLESDSEISTKVTGKKATTVSFDFSNAQFATVPDSVTYKVYEYERSIMIGQGAATSKNDAEAFGISYTLSEMVIMYDGSVKAKMTGSSDLVFKVEKLENTDNGLEYKPSDTDYGMVITAKNGEIVISNENEQAKAGTYRLTVSRMLNGTEFEKIEIPFFINY
ncbi:MAG: hypothetical protein IJF69_03720 [Clostridia bacterium]|nr:hypothetical protein [Clostridia bacterium]